MPIPEIRVIHIVSLSVICQAQHQQHHLATHLRMTEQQPRFISTK
jgi:hypothetical protein